MPDESGTDNVPRSGDEVIRETRQVVVVVEPGHRMICSRSCRPPPPTITNNNPTRPSSSESRPTSEYREKCELELELLYSIQTRARPGRRTRTRDTTVDARTLGARARVWAGNLAGATSALCLCTCRELLHLSGYLRGFITVSAFSKE